MKKYIIAAAAIGLVPGSASAAELLVNGSFEGPVVTGPCCVTSPPTPIPGWQATPNVNVVNGTFSSSPSGTNLAYHGNQYLDLVGEGGFGTISQTFNTIVGQVYTLSFAYSHNLFSGTPSASANFTVGGVDLVGSITHNTGTNSDLDWMTYSGNFVASNTSTILTFNNTVGGANEGILLDAVSVAGAVPEPATWALMLLGFGMVGGLMRRRNVKTTVAYA